MKRALVPLAFVFVPLVLGCGCVEGRATCTKPAVQEAPKPEQAPPAEVVKPATKDSSVPSAAAADKRADSAAPTAVALETR
jgi:hypothetical protein